VNVVVSGMVAGDPGQGGAAWAILQYVLGLRRLGHDVTLVEPVDELTPDRVSVFRRIMARFDLRAALVADDRSAGMTLREVDDTCRSADVHLNVSGMWRGGLDVPVRVYLDLDPAFNQLWADVEGIDVGLDGHTHHATVGQHVGAVGCEVPTCGRTWIRTLPPVVLEHWPYAATRARHSFTTIGNWRSYGSIEHGGRVYGQRAHSLRRLAGIASSSTHSFEVALAIHADEHEDLALLRRHGWRLVDPAFAASTPSAYRAFIRSSYAELSVAKSGYVESRCGWVSDRSVCYLASGRPVVALDTGLRDVLPVGEGLLVYTDEAEAVAAVDDVCARYVEHRTAARRLAEEHFDSDLVLTRLLDEVGAR
jgi:hypothetical protein